MSWKVGDRVRVEGYDCDGTVAFVGLHHEKEKPRVGVILDEPIGKGKGSFGGHQYFTCDTVSAVLVLPKKVSAAGSVFFEPGVVETEASETETVRTHIDVVGDASALPQCGALHYPLWQAAVTRTELYLRHIFGFHSISPRLSPAFPAVTARPFQLAADTPCPNFNLCTVPLYSPRTITRLLAHRQIQRPLAGMRKITIRWDG